jgi:hypothetical protein
MIYDNDWNVTQAVQMELFAFFVAPLIRLTVYHLGAVFLYFSHPGGWPTTFLMSIRAERAPNNTVATDCSLLLHLLSFRVLYQSILVVYCFACFKALCFFWFRKYLYLSDLIAF